MTDISFIVDYAILRYYQRNINQHFMVDDIAMLLNTDTKRRHNINQSSTKISKL